MAKLRLWLVAGSALILGGCAHQFMVAAQKECSSFGYTAGTETYAACVQQQYAAGQAGFQQRLLNASAIGKSEDSSTPTDGGATGTAFLRSNYVSGMNRICRYDRMGSEFVLTIGAAEMCPISVP